MAGDGERTAHSVEAAPHDGGFFYGLVPGLCQSSLLHDQYLEYPRELDDPRGPDSGFLRGARLVRFSWNSAGSLHATASFETVTGQILDVGFRWEGRQRPIPSLPKVDDLVDPRTTVLVLADHLQAIRFRPLLEKAKLESGETGPVFIPVVWDGAAWCEAPQAVHLFRFPATYRMNWQEKIGIPEKLEDLLAALPVGGVLDIRSMRILERVESWAGSNFTVAAQGSRMSRGRAKPIFIDLVNRALVRKFDGVYHLAEEGMKTGRHSGQGFAEVREGQVRDLFERGWTVSETAAPAQSGPCAPGGPGDTLKRSAGGPGGDVGGRPPTPPSGDDSAQTRSLAPNASE